MTISWDRFKGDLFPLKIDISNINFLNKLKFKDFENV